MNTEFTFLPIEIQALVVAHSGSDINNMTKAFPGLVKSIISSLTPAQMSTIPYTFLKQNSSHPKINNFLLSVANKARKIFDLPPSIKNNFLAPAIFYLANGDAVTDKVIRTITNVNLVLSRGTRSVRFYADGTVEFNQEGRRYRPDGPAYISENKTIWYEEDTGHPTREQIYNGGHLVSDMWYSGGFKRYHREGGPAFSIWTNDQLTQQRWYRNGELHRSTKKGALLEPAMWLKDGNKIIEAYYLNGIQVDRYGTPIVRVRVSRPSAPASLPKVRGNKYKKH